MYAMIARSGINKDGIAKKLFHNFQQVRLTNRVDYALEGIYDFASDDKENVYEIDFSHFVKTIAFSLCDGLGYPDKYDESGVRVFAGFLKDHLKNRFREAKKVTQSKENKGLVIRANVLELKNIVCMALEDFEKNIFVDELKEFIASANDEAFAEKYKKVIITDIKTDVEFSICNKNNVTCFVVVPYRLLNGELVQVGENPDFTPYGQNKFVDELSSNVFHAALDNQIINHEYSVVGKTLKPKGKNKEVNIIFVNLDKKIPDIEDLINASFDFVC